MWRTISSRTSRILNHYPIHQVSVRSQTTNPNNKRGGGGIFLALIGVGTLGVGGAAVYASYNSEFRQLLQNNLPYADSVFTFIPDWGSPKPKKTESPAPPPPSDISLMKKKQERVAAKKAEEVVIPEKSPVVPSSASASVVEKVKEKEVVENQKILAHQQAEQEKKSKEKTEEHQNSDLENRLNSCRDNLERLSQDSLLSHQRAVEAIRHHTQALISALELDMEASQDAWQEVNLALEGKTATLMRATETLLDANSALEHLEEEVKIGKKNPLTGNNSALLTAEEALERAKKEMQDAQAKLTEAKNEFGLAQGYQNMIEEGRKHLERELQEVLPHQLGKELSIEDQNTLLLHAHQRILQLQKRLAKQQTMEQGRVEQANSRQKVEQDILAKHQDELSRQRRELELQIAKQASDLKDDFEAEMRQQLRRAAAAHGDHLQEALGTQRDELQRHHNLRCKDQLLEQQASIHSTLGPAMARLKALELHLKAHEELQASSRRAQRLWLAAQSLKQCLVRHSSNETTGPLEERVQALRRASCISSATPEQASNGTEGKKQPEDPLYGVLLDSLPAEALNRGVYHEGALKARFINSVDPACKKSALLDKDETEGAIYKHLLSRIQAMLVFESFASAAEKSNDENYKAKSTYGILRSVQRSLASGDLEQALNRANQLSGVPRRLASDWTRELRLHLEVRQAADAIMAQAAAINVQAQQ